MKSTVIIPVLSALMAVPATLGAETFNVVTGQSVTYAYGADATGRMTFSTGTTLGILGRDFNLADVTSMYVDDSAVEANTVSVAYDGTTASVVVDGRLAPYLDITVEGAHVIIAQSADVGAATCGEITYVLGGTSSDGSFSTTGSYKATVTLDGLTLTNPAGAAIDIQNGKRIKLAVNDATVNTITDGASGSQKGCLVCKGHLEISGGGSLSVTANASHGIYAKEYITIEDATIALMSSVKDGINCNQYLTIESGTLDISGVGDDGIQVSFKDDTDREADDTGSITIHGGSIKVAATATAAKAIKADGDITVSGGSIEASVSGGGMWDSAKSKTKASTCISADGNMTVTGGTFNLHASNSAGKGISIDGDLTISGGEFTILTEGGIFAYVNGKEYSNYTGNTDNLDSDCKSSPKGIKADGNITIDGGVFNITTKGKGGEGIESKAVMTVNDGTFTLHTTDDALNSSSHMYINGGTITAIATDNDALDSNGNLYIAGGYIMAFGASAPECGIDANEEEGYTVIFTGGTLLATGGGSNSTPTTDESTQPYVSGSISVTGGTAITLRDGDTELCSFTIPSEYSSSGQGGGQGGWGGGPGGGWGGNSNNTLITCSGLTSGSSYTVTSGSSSTTLTATLRGSSSGGRPW